MYFGKFVGRATKLVGWQKYFSLSYMETPISQKVIGPQNPNPTPI
jgi:hypothetical protein